jgi:hypothetical protein
MHDFSEEVKKFQGRCKTISGEVRTAPQGTRTSLQYLEVIQAIIDGDSRSNHDLV